MEKKSGLAILIGGMKPNKEVFSKHGLSSKEEAPMEEEESGGDEGLLACAEELVKAIHQKDTELVAQILRDTFELLESEPHKEASHV
jgi:hypothetical protein